MNQHQNDRGRRIQDEIRGILLRDWDPLGINDVPEAQDEYDSYVGGVYRLLASGASESELVEHFGQIETKQMGLSVPRAVHETGWNAKLRAVAERLRAINVKL